MLIRYDKNNRPYIPRMASQLNSPMHWSNDHQYTVKLLITNLSVTDFHTTKIIFDNGKTEHNIFTDCDLIPI
jgi:hypothetical protein